MLFQCCCNVAHGDKQCGKQRDYQCQCVIAHTRLCTAALTLLGDIAEMQFGWHTSTLPQCCTEISISNIITWCIDVTILTWCQCSSNTVAMLLMQCCTLWLAMSVHCWTNKVLYRCCTIAGRHCRDAIWLTRCNVAAVLHRNVYKQYYNTASTMLQSSHDVTVAAMLWQCCFNVVAMLHTVTSNVSYNVISNVNALSHTQGWALLH